MRPESPLPAESSARSSRVGATQEERTLAIERARERTPEQARVLEGMQPTGEVVPVRSGWDARGESKIADSAADGQPLAADHTAAAGEQVSLDELEMGKGATRRGRGIAHVATDGSNAVVAEDGCDPSVDQVVDAIPTVDGRALCE